MVLVVLVHFGQHVGEELHSLVDGNPLDEGLVLVASDLRMFPKIKFNFFAIRVHLIISYYLSAVNQWIFLPAREGCCYCYGTPGAPAPPPPPTVFL